MNCLWGRSDDDDRKRVRAESEEEDEEDGYTSDNSQAFEFNNNGKYVGVEGGRIFPTRGLPAKFTTIYSFEKLEALILQKFNQDCIVDEATKFTYDDPMYEIFQISMIIPNGEKKRYDMVNIHRTCNLKWSENLLVVNEDVRRDIDDSSVLNRRFRVESPVTYDIIEFITREIDIYSEKYTYSNFHKAVNWETEYRKEARARPSNFFYDWVNYSVQTQAEVIYKGGDKNPDAL